MVAAWSLILFLGCLAIRAVGTMHVGYDPDEFQFLHSAWMIGRGQVPYRDFWTNNSPLFLYLLAPLVAIYDEDPSVLTAARTVAWVLNLGLFGVVAYLASRRTSWTAGLFAALLLATNLLLLEPSVNIRHDSLTVTLELIGMALFGRGVSSRRPHEILAAGATLGAALSLSPKALLALSGVVVGYVVHCVSSARHSGYVQPLRGHIRVLSILVAGTFGTFGLIVAALVPLEVWPIMIQRAFTDSFTNPDRFYALTAYLWRYVVRDPVTWLVLLGGLGVTARDWWYERKRADPRETVMLVGCLWFGLTYLCLMPSPYRQSAMPFVAILSIFGGRLLARAATQVSGATGSARKAAWSACLLVVVTWITVTSTYRTVGRFAQGRRTNVEAARTIDYVLRITRPGDVVFDGTSVAIFRPQASYYGSLTNALLLQIRDGELDFDIPARCEQLSCRVVIVDFRVARLPRKILRWIVDNYRPSPAFPDVLLHRSLVPSADG